IVALALDGSQQVTVLVSNADFYSNPRLSPNSSQLLWLCWNHPQMPWDGSECYLAKLNNQGLLEKPQLICGSNSESIFQPQWSANGELFFVSDKTNWWNLYRWNGEQAEPLCVMDAEFATPQWVFGMSTYGFLDTENILCCFSQDGQWQLAKLHIPDKKLKIISSGLTDISAITCLNGRALLLGASPIKSTELYLYDDQRDQLASIALSSKNVLVSEYLSQPEPINFATSDGETAYGFYYPPRNPDYFAPPTILPPLIVMCHGGPTGSTESSLNLKIQYWTSRGFAVLDVNYRGSTGYGRQYRDRLKLNWGVTDVIDVCSGVDHLIHLNLVDAEKVAIRGSS